MQNHNHPQPDEQKQSERKYLIALVVLCAVVNFYGLGSLPLIGPDEPRYAEVAREMYETGDWITPRLSGINWFEKPALTYWLSAVGYIIFGVSEFGARFGVAVIGSASVPLLFFFGKRIWSPRYGYLSASVLATCGLWSGFSRGATFDLPLSAAVALGLLSFFLWESREEQRGKNLLWWVFCFSLGLAVLAKGLVGVLLPIAIITPYLLLIRRLKILFKPGLILFGALIFLAVAATWYWPVIARNGREFIDEFFIAHHFQRYTSNKYRHPQPFYFFPLVAFAGSFPWSFFLASNGYRIAVRSLRKFAVRSSQFADNSLQNSETKAANCELRTANFNLFLWLWVLMPIIFFSFSGSKLPGYILPVFPAIAMIVGLELEQWWADKEPRRMTLLAISTAVLIFAVALLVALRGDSEIGLKFYDALTAATIAIVVAVIYLALWFLLSGRAATLFLPFGLAFVVIVTANLIFPALGRSESLRELSLKAKEAARAGERLIFYVNHDHGVNFYATDLPLRDNRSELITVASPEKIEGLIRENRATSILVASPTRWVDGINETSQLKIEQLAEQKRNKRCSPGCDWVLLRAELRK